MIVDALYIALGYKPDAKSLKSAEQALETVQSSIMKRAAAIGAALAPAAALKAIESLTNAYAQTVIQARDLAAAANTDVQTISSLGFAAEQAGLRVEDVGSALGSLRDKIKGATEGSADLIIDFNRIGVSAWNLRRMKPEERLLAIADAASKITDPTSRAGLALTRLVDPKLLPFLQQGREGIQKMQREAARMGLVITPDQVKQAEAFGGAQRALFSRVKALSTIFARELLPVLTPLIKRFTQLLDERKIGTVEDFARWAKDLAVEIADLYATMEKGYRTLEKTVEAFGGLSSVMGVIAAAVASIIGVNGLVKLLSMTKALTIANLKAAAASAAAFAPYILGAAAIFLVIAAIDELVGWMEGEDTMFTDLFGKATPEAIEDVQKMLFGVLGALGLVAAALGFAFLGPLVAVGAAVAALILYWDELGAMFESFFDQAIAWWDNFTNDMSESVRYVGEQIEKFFTSAVDSIRQAFVDLFTWLNAQADKVLAPYNAVMGAARSAGQRAGGAVASLFGSGASPTAAAAQRAVLTGGARNVNQNNEITIEVNAAGLSEQQAQRSVRGGVEDGLREIQQAYADGEI